MFTVVVGVDVTSPVVPGMTKVKGCSVMQVLAAPCGQTIRQGVEHSGKLIVNSPRYARWHNECAPTDAAVDCEGTRTVVSQSILVCACVCT